MDQEDSENLCPAEGTPARPRVPQAKPGELLAECTPAARPLQTRNAETVRAISPPGTVKQLCLSARCTCACAGLVLGVLSLATCSATRHSKLLTTKAFSTAWDRVSHSAWVCAAVVLAFRPAAGGAKPAAWLTHQPGLRWHSAPLHTLFMAAYNGKGLLATSGAFCTTAT